MRLHLPTEGSGGGCPIQETVPLPYLNRNSASQGRQHFREERISGLILYRIVTNGQDDYSRIVEYLLLKKVDQNDWTCPKGHVDSHEEYFEGAKRETVEETGFTSGDYSVLEQYPIHFEYKTRHRVLKKVQLWAAKLNFDKPVILSPEHDEFKWIQYEVATGVVKRQYKESLMAADLVVRTFETL